MMGISPFFNIGNYAHNFFGLYKVYEIFIKSSRCYRARDTKIKALPDYREGLFVFKCYVRLIFVIVTSAVESATTTAISTTAWSVSFWSCLVHYKVLAHEISTIQ